MEGGKGFGALRRCRSGHCATNAGEHHTFAIQEPRTPMDRDTPSGRPDACHVHPVAELKTSPRTPPSTGRAASRRGTEPTTSSPPAAICCRP
jgi:hypothetical protein